eukprot:796773-Alexandrium_andersonii.AAC.1
MPRVLRALVAAGALALPLVGVPAAAAAAAPRHAAGMVADVVREGLVVAAINLAGAGAYRALPLPSARGAGLHRGGRLRQWSPTLAASAGHVAEGRPDRGASAGVRLA